MLFLIRVLVFLVVVPITAIVALDMRATDICEALCAVRVFVDFAFRVRHVATLRQHFGAIGVSVFDHVVIKNLPVIFSVANQAPTLTLCTDGIAAHDPVANIKIMDVLLGDMIAAKPIKIVPITHLILHFIPVIFSFAHPHAC